MEIELLDEKLPVSCCYYDESSDTNGGIESYPFSVRNIGTAYST